MSSGDTVTGGGGSLTAGTGGNSLLTGQTGLIGLHAAGSNDTLVGGGNSVLYGASGLHTIARLTGGDVVVGVDTTTVYGPSKAVHNSTAYLTGGHETVVGGTGSMTINAGPGSSNIVLGSGSTTVSGGSGADTVSAGAGGQTTLVDGTGAELLTLIKGSSTGAALTWNGFASGKDLITLSGYGASAAQQVLQSQVVSSSGTVLTLSDGATIALLGVSHLAITDITSN